MTLMPRVEPHAQHEDGRRPPASSASVAMEDRRHATAQLRSLSELARESQRIARTDAVAQRMQAGAGNLPPALQAGIHRLSGCSLEDVRVHYNSSKPAQLSAHAYAQGNEIHLAPGQECHLPHEAWHLVQQAQGRVKPTFHAGAVPVNDDHSLESEADRMGARALQDSGRQGPASDGGAAGTRPAATAPVQRKLLINDVEQTNGQTTFATLDAESQQPGNGALLAVWQAANNKLATIDRMIKAGGTKSFKSFAWETLYKYYGRQRTLTYAYLNDRQAIRGVAGETVRDAGERREGDLAAEVLSSGEITGALQSASQKIIGAIAGWKANTLTAPPVTGGAPVPATLGDVPQKYKHYYSYASPVESLLGKVGKGTSPASILDNAPENSQGALIASIHDLTDQLFAAGNAWNQTVGVPGPRQVAHYRDAFGNIATEPITTVRPSRINEESEVMKQTRAAGMAVDVGPSYTTGRMLMLAESVNSAHDAAGNPNDWSVKITDQEMTAIALALFAFWNKTYWEASSGIHKYKFVVDMLSNFVPGADSTQYPPDLAAFMAQTKAQSIALGRTWTPPSDDVVLEMGA
jgi:hypothetical protein